MIKEKDGDLIQLGKQGEFDVIAHGCNLNQAWNSGIAKQMKMEIPEAFAVDLDTSTGDPTKLGTISFTTISVPTVVNCYTQFKYGNDQSEPVLADYDAIRKSLTALKEQFKGKKIGIPKIGAGRARGDWNVIKPIIEEVFCDDDDDVTIVNYSIVNTHSTHQSQQSSPNSVGHIRTPKFKPITNSQPSSSKKKQRYTIDYKTMNTNLHPRGKRICKICSQKKSVKEMISELHGVWTCKDKCHDQLHDMVVANHQQINPAPASVNVQTPTLSAAD